MLWYLIFGLVPLAVVLLAVSSLLPSHGRMHDGFQRVVSMVLFFPVPGLGLPFIKLALGGLGLVTLMEGMHVYKNSMREPLPLNAPADAQTKFQAKAWRDQRNLYLTALALALWWALFVTFSLKRQITKLIAERDAPVRVAASSGSAPVKRNVNVAGGAAAPSSGTATGEAVKQRRIPQPSAPEDPDVNTNAKHLD